MKRSIREKLNPKANEAIMPYISPSVSPIEAYSNVIEYLLDEGQKDSETSALIGHLVVRRDYLIRQQNTLQGRPALKGSR